MNSFPLSLFNTLRQAATHLAVLPEEVSVEIYLLSPPPFLMQSPKACPGSFCTTSKILAGQAKGDGPFCKMVLFSTKKRKTLVLTQNSSAASQESEYCQNEWDIKKNEKPTRQSRPSFFMVHITLHHPGWAPAPSLSITQNALQNNFRSSFRSP